MSEASSLLTITDLKNGISKAMDELKAPRADDMKDVLGPWKGDESSNAIFGQIKETGELISNSSTKLSMVCMVHSAI